MLTVAVSYRVSGRRALYECKTVQFYPDTPDSDMPGLYIGHADEEKTFLPVAHEDTSHADVYVMNSAGQTVARYEL